MNSVILTGRLTRDPERVDRGSTTICTFSIAVDRIKDGADFIRITVFGAQAESCLNNLTKGRQVAISGRIQTGSYKNREGNTVYTTDVIANHVEFLGSRSEQKEPTYYSATSDDLF